MTPVPRIAFVLGKPVRPDSVFPAIFDALRAVGFAARTHLPHDAHDTMPDWIDDAALIVHRGLRPASLDALGATGVPCVNPVAPVRLIEDRALLIERLASAGLPVPQSQRVRSWAEAATRAEQRAVVVKRIDARLGRGAGIAFIPRGGCDAPAPFPGPYLVQDALETDGIDRKLYVAGTSTRGLLKHWRRRDTSSARPFDPDPDLADLAGAVGRTLGLDVFGVDIVAGQCGPTIVDVNAFPSFTGVAGAGSLIARHIACLAHARS